MDIAAPWLHKRHLVAWLAVLIEVCAAGELLRAQQADRPGLVVRKATTSIVVDGNLSDEAWRGAATVRQWYETSPGDNSEPAVSTLGYLTYDENFLYIGLQMSDPDPAKIRAPYGDRDSVGPDMDYAGVVIDSQRDGKRAIVLRANPRGVQYDATIDDSRGVEDPSPDFYWDSRATMTNAGWMLELRVPFSSLRYKKNETRFRILLFRNYPRDFRYRIHSSRVPRGSPCLVCHSSELSGLDQLPTSSHVVAAPYMTTTSVSRPANGAGTAFVANPLDSNAGVDVKWTPVTSAAIDATVNPDFSQVEADAPQVAANERFALFYAERRPFFLEGIELLSTQIRAIHTRTITDPQWGARATGRFRSTAYSAMIAGDQGGGRLLLPEPNASRFVNQDDASLVMVGRVRRDIADSYVGGIVTSRDVDGGGSNRVVGPDFQWRHNRDRVTGQVLLSQTNDRERPGVTTRWTGRTRTDHAVDVWYARNDTSIDWFAGFTDIGDDFRADLGFVPQVGFRRVRGELGYEFHPTGAVRRVRPSAVMRHSTDRTGQLLSRESLVRLEVDSRWNSRWDVSFNADRIRALDQTLPRRRLRFSVSASPSQVLSEIAVSGFVGDEIDFDNARTGSGSIVTFALGVRPVASLEIRATGERRRLNVRGADDWQRLFTAEITRVRVNYALTRLVFLRAIAQYDETRRDPRLYTFAVSSRSGRFSGSAMFLYKVNWQTAIFVGYGDDRTLTDVGQLSPVERQFFAKVSYALQY